MNLAIGSGAHNRKNWLAQYHTSISPTIMQELTLHSIVVASPNQLSTSLDGEAIVLNLESGIYYGLADVAAGIWSLLQQPTTCADIAVALAEEYAVEQSRLEADVLAFVRDLHALQLVDVS
jgi:hypothetical protein